ncbi:unnamed protein product, partial [Porites lobata]
CPAEFFRGVDGELIFLSALNIILSITAFLGNTLILVALHKETSLHPPSKLLYRNLAITDLWVGIIVEPLAVTYFTSVVKERWDICYYAHLAGVFSGYTLSLCLVTTIFDYTKVSYTLRHNQIHVHNHVAQGQPSQAIPALNIARYRKAVYSALWVQGTLFICYLPHFIAVALQLQRGMTLSIYRAHQFTATLVHLNSSLNPLLYCWKIREVRQAVKETLRQIFGSSS